MKGLIHSLDIAQIEYREELVNVFTGELADETCNLHDAEDIGRRQSEEFASSLSDGFYDSISNIVKPMTPKTNKEKAHGNVIVDTRFIYCRAMVLLQTNSDRSEELSMENILSYELCGVPLSLFHEDGSMRVPKYKSQLKNILKEEGPATRGVETRVVILDGSAILWTIPWPAKEL